MSSWGVHAAALTAVTRQIEVCSPLNDCCSRIKSTYIRAAIRGGGAGDKLGGTIGDCGLLWSGGNSGEASSSPEEELRTPKVAVLRVDLVESWRSPPTLTQQRQRNPQRPPPRYSRCSHSSLSEQLRFLPPQHFYQQSTARHQHPCDTEPSSRRSRGTLPSIPPA